MPYTLQIHPCFCFFYPGQGRPPAHPILCPPLQPAEERSPGVPIPGPSHLWVLPQAHLICQQGGHGPANLVVGFHSGGAQQDEEEPVARQHISRAALSLLENISLGGDRGDFGDAGDGGWAGLGGFCHPKSGVWGQKIRLMSVVSAATVWQPLRDHGTPGPWLDHKGLQKSRLGGVGEQVFGTEEEKSSAGGVCGIIFLGMLLTGRMLVLEKESLPAAQAAGLTGLWGHGRKLERELRALDKIW